MRTLGLDLGTKTLGVAVSDKTGLISSPLKTINYKDYDYLLCEVKKIIENYEINSIVLGLPKNMDNSNGNRVNETLIFKNLLEKATNLKVILMDERLSTVEAENVLINADMSRKKRKKVIDNLAASIILDTYLRRKENGK